MKTRRLVVGILFVLVGLGAEVPANAVEPESTWEASVREVEPGSPGAEPSRVTTKNASRSRSGERSYAASDVAVLEQDLTMAAYEPQQSPAPLISQSPDQGIDEACGAPCLTACPSVYGQVEALFFQRVPRTFRQPIIVDSATNTTILSTSDLNYDYDPGLRATVGLRLNNCRTVEFDYFGLFSGNAAATVLSPGPGTDLTFPGNQLGNVNVFEDTNRFDVTYSSSLQSFAINLPCCCGCCDSSCCGDVNCRSFTWFGGLRYFSISERLNIAAQRDIQGGVEEGAYNLRTTNNLYGAQLGARLRRTSGRFGWDASGTAGIFGNDAQQTQSVTDFPAFQTRPTVTSHGGGVAFVGGGNLSALYLLNDVWNLRAGYSALWIEGLALAPDQLDFNFVAANGGSQLNHGGGMFLHGVNVGVEARW